MLLCQKGPTYCVFLILVHVIVSRTAAQSDRLASTFRSAGDSGASVPIVACFQGVMTLKTASAQQTVLAREGAGGVTGSDTRVLAGALSTKPTVRLGQNVVRMHGAQIQ